MYYTCVVDGYGYELVLIIETHRWRKPCRVFCLSGIRLVISEAEDIGALFHQVSDWHNSSRCALVSQSCASL